MWWHLISSGNVGPISSVALGERVALGVDLERNTKCCTYLLPISHVFELDALDQIFTVRVVLEDPLQDLYNLCEEHAIGACKSWPERLVLVASTLLD